MSIFKPFKAYRPVPKYAKDVASKPYDVLNSNEARNEAEGNSLSFSYFVKPEIDLQKIQIHIQVKCMNRRENFTNLITKGL